MTEVKITDITRVSFPKVRHTVMGSSDYRMMPKMTADMFEALLMREIEREYKKMVEGDMLALYRTERDVLELTRGERPGDDAEEAEREAWDDAIDDAMMTTTEGAGLFSMGFLGEGFVLTKAHEEGELEGLAARAAADAWRCARMMRDGDEAREMKPREMLDKMEVTRDIINAFIGTHTPPTEEQVKEHKMATRETALSALHYAKALYDGDDKAYEDDIELALDSDELLSGGALERMGVGREVVSTLADLAAEHSYDFAAIREDLDDTRHAMTPTSVEAAEAGATDETEAVEEAQEAEDDDLSQFMGGAEMPAAAPPPPPPPPAPAITTGAGPAPKKRDAKATEGTAIDSADVISGEVLAACKEALGIKDETVATGLGMSRATFNNYVKGKGTFVASDEQHAFLRGLLIQRRDELNAALASVGGRG